MSASKIFKAKDNIDYTTNATVSKTIVKKPGGSITLFAFADGEELAEHRSPHEALVQVLEGKAEIIIAGQLYIVESEQSIVLPADVPHALKAKEKFKMLLTMIKS